MLKKTIAAVIAASMMMLPCTGHIYAADEAALSFGDPNGDGKIDAKDASFVLEAYAKLSTGSEDVLTAAQSTAADVKTDGNVDAKDASAILAYYAYLSTGGTYTLAVYLGYEKPEEYEYKLENITKSADVFNHFANQLNYDILQGKEILLKHIDGGEYWTNGKYESKVALFLLNENNAYAPGILRDIFGNYNTQDFEDGILYMLNASCSQELADSSVDFNDYSTNSKVGKYMNKIESAWKNAKNTNDCSELDSILSDFYSDEQLVFNNAAYFYSLGIPQVCTGSEYLYYLESINEEFTNTREQIKAKISNS